MQRSHAARLLLLACFFALVMRCQGQGIDKLGERYSSSSSDDDDDEIDWGAVIRVLVDLFNLVVVITEHCGPSAKEGDCSAFAATFVIVLLVFVLVSICCSCCGVDCDFTQDGFWTDVVRANNLRHSVQKVDQWVFSAPRPSCPPCPPRCKSY